MDALPPEPTSALPLVREGSRIVPG